MVDAYTPLLDEIQFEEDEVAAMDAAMQTDDPWDWKPGGEQEKALKRAKDKIREFHLRRHGETCCYCRTNLHGAGSFMTDREHVLPKSKTAYRPFTYTMWNLAVACKRCNMQFKKNCDAFVLDKVDPAAFLNSNNYLLIHPNFDRWEKYLNRVSAQVNDKSIVVFSCSDEPKARYTYDYFHLEEVVIDSFDLGQGMSAQDGKSEIAVLVRKLAERFGQ